TDPDAVAAAFAWAADRARGGNGPALIELVTLRMAGHAHHDDMLYLGRDPRPSWDYAAPDRSEAYADRDLFADWSARDPLVTYSARLQAEGIIAPGDLDRLKAEAEAVVEAEARAVINASWPDAASAAMGVFADEAPRVRRDPLDGMAAAAAAQRD